MAVQPVILTSLDEICRVFRVGRGRVLAWVECRAPIAVLDCDKGQPRYRAELNELQAWLVEQGRKEAA